MLKQPTSLVGLFAGLTDAAVPAAVRRHRIVLTCVLLGTLGLLLAHSLHYLFLTDDAFISFRYARNLASGDGLVFNPGGERVEGYTNLLWVLLLAAAQWAGLAPELTAHLLSLALTVGLWALVVGFIGRETGFEERNWLLAAPVVLLAATRSVAVWSSGGLETRLFEFLVVAGCFRLLLETRAPSEDKLAVRPLAGGLFALATLTRPDGLLIFASVFGTTCVALLLWRRLRPGWFLTQLALFGFPVGAHFLFRRAYYGDWLPNTYYAKLDGTMWWTVGVDYLVAFVLEYAMVLWLPLLLAGVLYHLRRRETLTPLVFGAAVLPHTLYVVSIGGDHFEYRPFDLYFTFCYLLIFTGARYLARTPGRAAAAGAYLVFVLVGIVALPYRSHVQFPEVYSSGYPGLGGPGADDFLSPGRDPIYGQPGFRAIAREYQQRVRGLTGQFAAIRQEEHAAFRQTVERSGNRLRALIDRGILPQDTLLAIDSVGVIPYRSDLPVLDRLGLTDRTVAHGEVRGLRLMAHDKYARYDYAIERRVDLWAQDHVHVVIDIGNPVQIGVLWRAHTNRAGAYLADVGDGAYVLAKLPRGLGTAAERFPKLAFRPVDDYGVVGSVLESSLRSFEEQLRSRPTDPYLKHGVALILSALRRYDEAIEAYIEAIDSYPRNQQAHLELARLLANRGRVEDAIRSFETALAIDPDDARAHQNLAMVLQSLERTTEAEAHYRDAVGVDPEFVEAWEGLGQLLLTAGNVEEGILHLRHATELQDSDEARLRLASTLAHAGREADAATQYAEVLRGKPTSVPALNSLAWLRATSTEASVRDADAAVDLATAGCEQTGYRDASLLLTLAVAYAGADRLDEARQQARAARAAAASDPRMTSRIDAIVEAIESGWP